jgi:hypothetical protein
VTPAYVGRARVRARRRALCRMAAAAGLVLLGLAAAWVAAQAVAGLLFVLVLRELLRGLGATP